MRKLSLYTFFIVALLFCGHPVCADNQFRIGVIAPLTGGLAEYGVAIRNGIELARGEHPSKLSRLITIYEDDQYDGKKTIAAFNKLHVTDDIDLLYLWGTGPAHALAPIVEQRRFPTVAMTIDPAPALGKNWMLALGSRLLGSR